MAVSIELQIEGVGGRDEAGMDSPRSDSGRREINHDIDNSPTVAKNCLVALDQSGSEVDAAIIEAKYWGWRISGSVGNFRGC
jgi:hypothetical protein